MRNASEISKTVTARLYIIAKINNIRTAEKADVGAKFVSFVLLVLNSLATSLIALSSCHWGTSNKIPMLCPLRLNFQFLQG
jgi:hypothetical protein